MTDVSRSGARRGVTLPFIVREVHAAADISEVRRLVLEHAEARATTPGVDYMRADAVALPGPYVPPRGGIWLATSDDVGVGCVALREMSDECAEVKRMFVAAEWRGRGVGRALLSALVAGARERGYTRLRLGTLEDMTAARALYHSFGFAPIARYRPDELMETMFYEMPLT